MDDDGQSDLALLQKVLLREHYVALTRLVRSRYYEPYRTAILLRSSVSLTSPTSVLAQPIAPSTQEPNSGKEHSPSDSAESADNLICSYEHISPRIAEACALFQSRSDSQSRSKSSSKSSKSKGTSTELEKHSRF